MKTTCFSIFFVLLTGALNAQTTTPTLDEIELAPALSSKPQKPAVSTDIPTSIEQALISYLAPIQVGPEQVIGRTIGQTTTLKSEYPPIVGLDDAVWKDKFCTDCHQWSRAALCTHSQTYVAKSVAEIEEKLHPFGGGFRRILRKWAMDGCL